MPENRLQRGSAKIKPVHVKPKRNTSAQPQRGAQRKASEAGGKDRRTSGVSPVQVKPKKKAAGSSAPQRGVQRKPSEAGGPPRKGPVKKATKERGIRVNKGGGGGKKRSGGKASLGKKLYRSTIGNLMPAPKVVLEGFKAQEAVRALALTDWQVHKLKQQFDDIDIDGSGEIDQEEFFLIMNEARSPFTDALFNLIDADSSGTIEFEEYILVLLTYCMYTEPDILKFSFDFFDKDKSGQIDEAEYVELCKVVNNAQPLFPQNFKNALEMFDTNQDGLIDFNEFRLIHKRFPMILHPAFRLQDRMQKITLGEHGWSRVLENIEKQRYLNTFMEENDGEVPKASCSERYGKCLLPNFLYRRLFGVLSREVDVETIELNRPASKAATELQKKKEKRGH